MGVVLQGYEEEDALLCSGPMIAVAGDFQEDRQLCAYVCLGGLSQCD